MKYLFYILLGFFLILASCTDDNEFNKIEQNQACNQFRSESDILEIASNASEIFSSKSLMSRKSSRILDKNSKPIAIGKTKSRSSEPLMYAVNYADSEGYVIIPSSQNAPEIIAFVEEGSFSNSSIENNPGLNIYLKDASNYLSSLEPIDTLRPSNEKTVYEPDTVVQIGPFLNNRWRASSFDYSENPNLAGTSEIAISFFLAYYKYTGSIDLTYLNNDSTIEMDWDAFYFHFSDQNQQLLKGDLCTTRYPDCHNQMASLVREIGYRSNTDYSSSFPSTSPISLEKTLKSLSIYSISEYSATSRSFASQLPSHNIIIVLGKDDTYGDQAWLCDGYIEVRQRVKRYVSHNNGLTWEWDGGAIHYTQSQYFNHFNWCCRASNGYYLDLNFKPRMCPLNFKSEIKYWCITPESWMVGF